MTTTSPHLRQSRALFQNANPFAASTPTTAANTTTRSPRSPSSSSTASFRSAYSQPPTSSLAEILSQSFSTTNSLGLFTRTGSFAARNGSFSSFGNSSAGSSRRPSCFSILEMEEEKAEFGEGVVGLLEPRPGLGWWGVGEVLAEEEAGTRRGSLV
ncbi:hypothetical protein MMC30_002210 [Trapelia coarctata]|nr:hypothetical protein [Trapelia coarctata]